MIKRLLRYFSRREWEGGVVNEGCESRYTCCQASLSHCGAGCSPRYSCCGAPVTGLGCRKVCKKCGGDWATPANGCFRREHALHSLDGEGEEDVEGSDK